MLRDLVCDHIAGWFKGGKLSYDAQNYIIDYQKTPKVALAQSLSLEGLLDSHFSMFSCCE